MSALRGAVAQRAIISTTAIGDATIVPAVVGKAIRVIDYAVGSSGATNSWTWKSGSTPISGVMGVGSNATITAANSEAGVLQTAVGQALVFSPTAVTALGGHLTYVVIPV